MSVWQHQQLHQQEYWQWENQAEHPHKQTPDTCLSTYEQCVLTNNHLTDNKQTGSVFSCYRRGSVCGSVSLSVHGMHQNCFGNDVLEVKTRMFLGGPSIILLHAEDWMVKVQVKNAKMAKSFSVITLLHVWSDLLQAQTTAFQFHKRVCLLSFTVQIFLFSTLQVILEYTPRQYKNLQWREEGRWCRCWY